MTRRAAIIAAGVGEVAPPLFPGMWAHYDAGDLDHADGYQRTSSGFPNDDRWYSKAGTSGPVLDNNTLRGKYKANWTNGQPAVLYDSGSQKNYSAIISKSATGWVIHVVFDTAATSQSYAGILFLGSAGPDISRRSGAYLQTYWGAGPQVTPNGSIPSTPTVLTYVMHDVAGTIVTYVKINGAEYALSSGLVTSIPNLTMVGHAHRSTSGTTTSLLGHIGEHIIYDFDIGEENIDANHQSLMTKYGIAA